MVRGRPARGRAQLRSCLLRPGPGPFCRRGAGLAARRAGPLGRSPTRRGARRSRSCHVALANQAVVQLTTAATAALVEWELEIDADGQGQAGRVPRVRGGCDHACCNRDMPKSRSREPDRPFQPHGPKPVSYPEEQPHATDHGTPNGLPTPTPHPADLLVATDRSRRN